MKVLAAVLAGLTIAAALAWNAAELHYRNCIDAARASVPAERGTGSLLDQRDSLIDKPGASQASRVNGCSRIP